MVVSGKPFGGLMDCSRRTIAAMFSDILMCEPCLALSEKREKFFFAAAKHVALYFSSYLVSVSENR